MWKNKISIYLSIYMLCCVMLQEMQAVSKHEFVNVRLHTPWSFYCSLHRERQLHSRQKLSDKKWEGSKAWKALNFKKWGLKPRSLIEVYACACPVSKLLASVFLYCKQSCKCITYVKVSSTVSISRHLETNFG